MITSLYFQPNKCLKTFKTAQDCHAVWTFQLGIMLLGMVHSGVTETRMIRLPCGAINLTSFYMSVINCKQMDGHGDNGKDARNGEIFVVCNNGTDNMDNRSVMEHVPVTTDNTS